ncbi:MAG: endonuclease/exonuclease/phosphatase family metal-dependent hydrolase [Oleiphilaceae bacterium]|jgi:endonuclease/exonuclease/phosphatase family metal-dependent hydrolase
MKTTKLGIFLLLILSVNASALTVMEINTEWMWDDNFPHSGRLVGTDIKPPTRSEYQSELSYYASIINENKADVVALIEIEGCHVAEDLLRIVNKGSNNYGLACRKGRDTFTGQDVAVITTLRINKSSIDTFPTIKVHYKGKRIGPSKVLGFVAKDNKGKDHIIIATHLISKRGNNDGKRLAQAQAISLARQLMHQSYKTDSAIILGDLNDTPGSETLNELTSGEYPLTNPYKKKVCSYTYRGKCSLIDHILVTRNLSGGKLDYIEMPKKYSDHNALVYKLKR